MQERLIHFIWQNLLFSTGNLFGMDGEKIQIIHRGFINSHAGPDFTNAKIKMDETLWAGNVEIHIKSGDWIKHGHTSDKSYDNTILHVCWESDGPVYRTDGTKIACLVLQDKVDHSLLDKYDALLSSPNEIPCSSLIHKIDDFTWNNWQERLVAERLEHKTENIFIALKQLNNDWNEVFYRLIARSFGLTINTEPFETLARMLPFKFLTRHRKNPLQIESLIFGVSGFLNQEREDLYPQQLNTEYAFLKKKYGLKELDYSEWKFLRLMPANFPSIRLAQFAALIHLPDNIFSHCIEMHSFQTYAKYLKIKLNPYWDTHYLFDQPATKREKNIGETLIYQIILNTIVPFQFAYGIYKDDQSIKQNALDMLLNCKPENNAIVRKWAEIGIISKNSWQTQALLQLKNEYCSKKRCVECQIGFKLLKNEAI
jgi:hypothetical protein